jgi:hypothetical protein
VVVYDTDSPCGTQVNGQHIVGETPLRLRDVITLGRQRLWLTPAPTIAVWSGRRDSSDGSQAIRDEQRFDRLAQLAEALQKAGCTDADLLGHLRSPGPHVRGCWAVDLVLGKS